MEWSGRQLSLGPSLGDRAIKRRKRFRHSDVEMLKTVGNRPTTGGGVPVELGFGEAGGDHPAVCFDRLELLEHVPKFQGHQVILGDHPVCRGGRGSHHERTVFFIVATCCNTFAGRPSPHSCCCCLPGCARKRCPTRWSYIRRTRSRTSAAIR